MPKRSSFTLKDFSGDYIALPAALQHPLLSSYLADPNCRPIEQLLTNWLSDDVTYRQMAEEAGALLQESRYFVECHKAFQKPDELPNRFSVVRRVSLPLVGFGTVGVRFSVSDAQSIRDALLEKVPFRWDIRRREGKRSPELLFLFGQVLWAHEPADSGYSPDELALRFADAAIRERRKRERLEGRRDALVSRQDPGSRPSIPAYLSAFIWERDQGRCACGSRVDLQIDHIIPVSLGGATSAGNLQLMCLQCNLEKGARI